MSVAAHVAAWLQKPGGWRSPVSGGFTADEVHPCVELFLGGEWVDISSYVYYRDMIDITRGRSSEASQLDPSSCSFTLNNRDGRFAPRNPTGAYYGLIGRNTPVRVSVTRNGVRWYRFYGEVSSWRPQADISGKDSYVRVEAGGILRRLSQGESPLKSPLYRSITQLGTRNDYRAYWPCEDQEGATNMASALDGGIPMTYSGTKPTFASYDGLHASGPVLVLGATELSGPVARYTVGTAQIVRVLMRLPESVASTQSLLKVACAGDLPVWELEINTSAQLNFTVTASDGTTAYSSGFLDFDATFGENCSLAFRMTQSGSDVIPLFVIAHLDTITSFSPVSITNNQATSTISSTTFGRVTRITIGDDRGISGCAVGHLVVNNSDLFYGELSSLGPSGDDADVSALLGNCGENPAARIHRLCNEEEISFISPGSIDDTVGMGFQKTNNLTDLIQECATTSAGLLYEPRDQIGIGFHARKTLYGKDPALTLDANNYELSSQLIPTDDDRNIFNDVVVTSTSDTSAHVTLDEGPMSTQAPPDGVGRYDTSITVNQVSDGFQGATVLNAEATLQSLAGWKLHEGTVDEPRYPNVSVNLRHSTFTDSVGNMNSALSLDIGSVLHIENPPAWSPQETVRALIQGYTEILGAFEHDITFNTSPMSVWDVPELNSAEAVLDSDEATLTSAVGPSDTTLSVTTTGQVWVDSAAYSDQFPLSVEVEGETMTVTAITGTTSPQDFTVTRSVNGVTKSLSSGATVSLAQPAYLGL